MTRSCLRTGVLTFIYNIAQNIIIRPVRLESCLLTQLCILNCSAVTIMSHFRIQRKLTESSSIRLKPSLSNPQRIKSLQNRNHSFSRSPKRPENQLQRLVQKLPTRHSQEETAASRLKIEEGIKAYKAKDVSKALEAFREAQKAGERSAELSFYLGSCLLNLGKHQASILALNQCLLLSPKHSPTAYLYIAVNFKLIGNLKQAVRILEQSISVFPLFQEGHFYRAKILAKMGEHSTAAQAFSRCLQLNPNNELAAVFLGDCHKNLGKDGIALEYYRKVARQGKKYALLAGTKTARLLFEQEQYQEVYDELMRLIHKGQENAEVDLLLGLSCRRISRNHQAAVYLEGCLSSTKQAHLAIKALQSLIQMSVQQGNFFEADHHISRISQFKLKSDVFKQWQLFVEGVNDLIKRKNTPALHKFSMAAELGIHQPDKEIFLKGLYPYLGYALYMNSKLQQATQVYAKAVEFDPSNTAVAYSHYMAQGLYHHEKKQFSEAALKFQSAFEKQSRPEAMFLASISLIQRYRSKGEDKAKIFQLVEGLMQKGRQAEGRKPLMLFYNTLVLLYQGKPCVDMIKMAISACQDEPVSQYHFIEALALQPSGQIGRSIEAITKAIQIDPGIEEFYRERSKYYFLAEQYERAIQDCLKAQTMAPEDEQLPLLLSFYHYLEGNYLNAHHYLMKVKPDSGKLKQFQQALYLRLKQYHNLGIIGNVLMGIQSNLITEDHLGPIQAYVSSRHQFSEFSVYFYHLILAIGWSKLGEHQKALGHLFGCLQEIQILVDERETQHAPYEVTWEETQSMLDEIKFNIVIVSLLKQNLEQTENYIRIFVNQTESQYLKDALLNILKIIKKEDSRSVIRLEIFDDYERISDTFPEIKIKVRDQQVITRLLVGFPVKLKFTIAPEFDPAYLLNFDVDKVQYRIPPPWLRTPTQRVNFTNTLRNESVLLSDSQISERRSPTPRPLRQQLKLDEQLEAKLNRILRK